MYLSLRNLDEIQIDPQERVPVDSEGSDFENEKENDASPSNSAGSSQNPRRKWSAEEIQALEKTLMDYISSGKVPGKGQCMECIEKSPAALQGSGWEAVKFYVKNRDEAKNVKVKSL
ncbi:uncharacterized protein LOC124397231 [Silurus meridionalis]|uniref:uncharacterized protein LOC124397231 n=1 Tax=Silurus meridionalis TaxID=175797 RepID=UPI001EECF03E|nr:uncharacterized protein LOC124397231 [Silurus meridionalis]